MWSGTYLTSHQSLSRTLSELTQLYLSMLKANCLVRLHSTCQNLTSRGHYVPTTYRLHWDETKQGLDRLVKKDVLAPVTEPTDWVSQMAVTRKKNGSVHVCIDLAPLNLTLMSEHYRLPTVDDSLDKFSDCWIFSKLDVRNAYWHI